MHPKVLVDISAELLGEYRCSPSASDRVVRQFIRQKKFLGSKDRKIVVEAFYHALRHMMRIDESIRIALEGAPVHLWVSRSMGFPITQSPNDQIWSNPLRAPERPPRADKWFDTMRIALAVEDQQPGFLEPLEAEFIGTFPVKGTWSAREWIENLVKRSRHNLRLLAEDTKPLRAPLRYSIPEWMWGQIGVGLPAAEHSPACEALNHPAPVSIRVNTLKTNAPKFRALLEEKGFLFRPSEYVPDGLVGDKRVRPSDLPGYEDGMFEFQDEGSQLVAELVSPRAGIRVIDACAGAGGKSLHFAAKMKDEGEILMHDSVPGRLKNAVKRAATAGASIARVMTPDEAGKKTPADYELADIVLIDAPCSGSGTIRRSPELKWRLSLDIVMQRACTQAQVLADWSRWVRPGGLLVYVTCSLFHGENGAQIDAFLATHPEFQREGFEGHKFARPDMIQRTGDVQLYPHRHGTDGFFVARLKRKEG